ncbi:multicopper oxidase family protein [Actinomycetes bacterium KLBMP 9797]
MTLSRRDVIRIAGGAALALPFASACQEDSGPGSRADPAADETGGALLRSSARLPAPFGVPLPVPPVLQPVSTSGGVDRYQITQRVAKVELLPGLQTEIWGYEGRLPGPTIVSRSGRGTVVRHRNELPVPVAVHLHGGVTPPEHDGYPTDLITPAGGWPANGGHNGHTGQTSDLVKEYTYPLEQQAATLWYHDHRMDFTGPQVYRGLAGFHLVHDDNEDSLPLPKGDRDIPLMIFDRSFAEDGSFPYPSLDPSLRDRPGVTTEFMGGVLGDVILVNGAPWPRLEVSNTRYRFRLLNASNARRYRLALDPPPPSGDPFIQIGSDVGLLGSPLGQSAIEISPAQRYDVVVDFSGYPVNTQVVLRNEIGEGGAAQVMRFDVVRRATDDTRVPDRLSDFEELSRSSAARTRDLKFVRRGSDGMWTVNGQPFDPNRDDFDPRLNSTEVWRIKSDAFRHPVHMHLAHFQVLSRDKGDQPWDAGWKDTVELRRGETVELIARFTGYAGRYVFHCHNLEHEDMAMMANMRVV